MDSNMYGYISCFLMFLPVIQGNFLVQPLDSTSVVGEVAILRCTINKTESANALFYWSKDNNHLSVNNNIVESLDRGVRTRLTVVGNRSVGEYNLRIENLRRTDAGSYICSYIGISGGQTSRPAVLTILIPPRKEFPLCFVLAQSLRSSGDGFWPGQTARLRCVSVGGEPAATLVWKRKNATISSTKTGESIHERVLTPSDNGVAFTCQATSPALRVPKTCEVIPLRILPTVHIRLMTREVIQGSNATYHCEASALPKVGSITWFFAGEEVKGNNTATSRIITSDDKQFITITDIRADEHKIPIECSVSTPTGLESSDTMKMQVTRKQVDTSKDPSSLSPDGRTPKRSDMFPWSSELHVIIIMVVGSLVGVLIFISAILICWGFGRAKKPRRANTRLQVDHLAANNQELILEPLTYPSQIVYNTLGPDTDSLPRRREGYHTGSFDENSPGYLQSLYATVDRRNSGYSPRFSSLPIRPVYQEKPVAQINPTTSPKRNPVIPFVSQHSSQPLIGDKDSYKESSSRDSASSADESEIF